MNKFRYLHSNRRNDNTRIIYVIGKKTVSPMQWNKSDAKDITDEYENERIYKKMLGQLQFNRQVEVNMLCREYGDNLSFLDKIRIVESM